MSNRIEEFSQQLCEYVERNDLEGLQFFIGDLVKTVSSVNQFKKAMVHLLRNIF